MDSTTDYNKVRIDKWLWAARFFKTRSKAKDAVVGGKIHVNGDRVKPARNIRKGDSLAITLSNHRVNVVVKGVTEQRGPAKIAQNLYEETQASIDKRTEQMQQRKLAKVESNASRAKPNRTDRRRLAQLKQKGWVT